MEKRFEYVIGHDSCNGEAQEFADWVTSSFPDTVAMVGLEGYVFDRETGERVTEEDVYGHRLWELYCSRNCDAVARLYKDLLEYFQV